MQVIVFKNDQGGVSVVIPAPDYADQIEAVAEKDVPKGSPWRIVEDTDLPSRDVRSKWVWTDTGSLDVATE